MSVFAWLDYSETERRRMMDVISLFAEKDTVDELGIGTVRDSLADLLFPGTSTVMTRVRYYLFVPWLYRTLEQKRVPSSEFGERARKAEIDLIKPLTEAYARPANLGIIGIDSGRQLKRLPSSIYWAGLRTWGIRQMPGTQADYHRGVDELRRRRDAQRGRGEHRGEEHDDVVAEPWHPGLVPPPQDFPRTASLELRPLESEYLIHRIETSPETSGSLLARLVHDRSELGENGFIWQHVDFVAKAWPAPLMEQVEHARCFSEMMHGAQLLYNHLLALKKDHVSDFEAWLDEWAEIIEGRSDAFARWDKARFWELVRMRNPRLGHPGQLTTLFISEWWRLVEQHGACGIAKSKAAHRLIEGREVQLKKGLARLTNQSALNRWQGSSGTGQMDFRWAITRRLLADIFAGLRNTEEEIHAAA